MPDLVGRPNESAALFNLARLLVIHMRHHARDLAARGGVELTSARIEELGEALGLPSNLAQRQVEAWVTGVDPRTGNAVVPLLKSVDQNRVTLADCEAGARRFLEQAGQRELDGAARSRRRKGARKG